MAELPFLVVHGALVWKVLAVAIATVCVAHVWRRRRVAERRRVAAVRAEHAAWVSAPTEGFATVRGVLRGGSATSLTVTTAGGVEKRHHDRADTLWLDCGGERVDLEGPLWVRCGTRVIATRGTPGALPEAIQAQRPVRAREARLATVVDGDVVTVRGTLARRASAGEVSDYRAPAGGWLIEGTVDVELCAERAAAPAVPLGWVAGTLGFGLACLLAIGALAAIGKLALAVATRGEEVAVLRVPAELGGLDAIAIAAATPWSRADALERLMGRLRDRYQRTEESLELRFQLARLLGCRHELVELREAGRLEELLARADECEQPDLAAEALLLLGRYAEASARGGSALEPRDRGVAAIGAGRWLDAARAAADLRSVLVRSGGPSVEGPSGPVTPGLECAELLFRTRAGDGAALGELRARSGRDPQCALMDAVARPPAEQVAALAAARAAAGKKSPLGSAMELLSWAAGRRVTGETGEHIKPALHSIFTLSMNAADDALSALLAPLAAERSKGSNEEDVVATGVWLAAFELLRGDFAAAQEVAQRAGGRDPEVRHPRRYAHEFLAMLALRTGAPPPFGLESRVSQHLWRVFASHGYDCALDGRRAFAAADGGDGGPLADLLARCDLVDGESLFPVMPRVRRGRDRLVARIRLYQHDGRGFDWVGAPFGLVGAASLRRDLLRLIGDSAEAARWQTIIDRHMAALADRDRLTAMIIWLAL